MNPENGPSAEEIGDDGLTPEQRQYAEGMLTLPENSVKVVAKSELRDGEQEIAELQQLFREFEQNHSLEELNAITGLDTVDLARSNNTRESARLSLIPISEKLQILKNETDISSERYERLNSDYQRLWNALGVMQNGKISHEIIRK